VTILFTNAVYDILFIKDLLNITDIKIIFILIPITISINFIVNVHL